MSGIQRVCFGCVSCSVYVYVFDWYLNNLFGVCVYVCMVFKGLVLVVCIVCVCVYGI